MQFLQASTSSLLDHWQQQHQHALIETNHCHIMATSPSGLKSVLQQPSLPLSGLVFEYEDALAVLIQLQWLCNNLIYHQGDTLKKQGDYTFRLVQAPHQTAFQLNYELQCNGIQIHQTRLQTRWHLVLIGTSSAFEPIGHLSPQQTKWQFDQLWNDAFTMIDNQTQDHMLAQVFADFAIFEQNEVAMVSEWAGLIDTLNHFASTLTGDNRIKLAAHYNTDEEVAYITLPECEAACTLKCILL